MSTASRAKAAVPATHTALQTIVANTFGRTLPPASPTCDDASEQPPQQQVTPRRRPAAVGSAATSPSPAFRPHARPAPADTPARDYVPSAEERSPGDAWRATPAGGLDNVTADGRRRWCCWPWVTTGASQRRFRHDPYCAMYQGEASDIADHCTHDGFFTGYRPSAPVSQPVADVVPTVPAKAEQPLPLPRSERRQPSPPADAPLSARPKSSPAASTPSATPTAARTPAAPPVQNEYYRRNGVLRGWACRPQQDLDDSARWSMNASLNSNVSEDATAGVSSSDGCAPATTAQTPGSGEEGTTKSPQQRRMGRIPVAFVAFRYGRADMFRLPENWDAATLPGAVVLVEGDRGVDCGRVVHVDQRRVTDPQLRTMRSVLTVAQDMDLLAWQHLSLMEHAALAVARDVLEEVSRTDVHLQSMSFVTCEYQFDLKKLTIFFDCTMQGFAPEFRSLLRPLFAKFDCRIWLQARCPTNPNNKAASSKAAPVAART